MLSSRVAGRSACLLSARDETRVLHHRRMSSVASGVSSYVGLWDDARSREARRAGAQRAY